MPHTTERDNWVQHSSRAWHSRSRRRYGPQTTRAVIAFQQTEELTADGVVGTKTLQALKRALRK